MPPVSGEERPTNECGTVALACFRRGKTEGTKPEENNVRFIVNGRKFTSKTTHVSKTKNPLTGLLQSKPKACVNNDCTRRMPKKRTQDTPNAMPVTALKLHGHVWTVGSMAD